MVPCQIGVFNEENCSLIELIQAPRAKIDLVNLDLIKEFITRHSPEIVINCAAYTNVDLAEEERSLCNTINSEAVGETIRGCTKLELSLFTFQRLYL